MCQKRIMAGNIDFVLLSVIILFLKPFDLKNIIIFVDLKICSYICEQHLIIWMKKGIIQ